MYTFFRIYCMRRDVYRMNWPFFSKVEECHVSRSKLKSIGPLSVHVPRAIVILHCLAFAAKSDRYGEIPPRYTAVPYRDYYIIFRIYYRLFVSAQNGQDVPGRTEIIRKEWKRWNFVPRRKIGCYSRVENSRLAFRKTYSSRPNESYWDDYLFELASEKAFSLYFILGNRCL